MMTAAVVSSFRAPSIRPAGFSSVSPARPRICGITATPVSKPDRPRASLGKTSSAMATTMSGFPWEVVRALPPVTHGHRMGKALEDRGGDHDHVQAQVDCNQGDGDADGLLEAAQEHRGQQCQQEQRDENVLSLHPARGKRVVDGVGRGVGGGQRHGDHEVCGGEPQQDQDQELPAPARQQPLKHGDGSLAAMAFAGNPAVDRERAEQGDGHQHQRGQRGDHPGGQGGDGRLVAQRGEVVHAGQAHHLPPRMLLQVRVVTRRSGALMGSLGVLKAEQQPAPEVFFGAPAVRPGDPPAACSSWSFGPFRVTHVTAFTADDNTGSGPFSGLA